MNIIIEHMDNGGRRTGNDRRKFSYSGYIPERRSQTDRRFEEDRRKSRYFIEIERRTAFRT